MKFATTLAGLAALFASATQALAQHATSATVTGFSAIRNATHIKYVSPPPFSSPLFLSLSFLIPRAPSSPPFPHSLPPSSAVNQVRVLLSDTHVVGNTVNLDYLSPLFSSDWQGAGAGGASAMYTGPASFTLT
ncbi:hypothetical protein QR685DRAFT_596144 [Neurospora intermedia]|uniref:Uncharacterized protein n=1 Tax=Neurospora intermedia TaxID=5142 RepID=A0ABR3DGL2_NEUIN